MVNACTLFVGVLIPLRTNVCVFHQTNAGVLDAGVVHENKVIVSIADATIDRTVCCVPFYN